jgi:hypothetical protein
MPHAVAATALAVSHGRLGNSPNSRDGVRDGTHSPADRYGPTGAERQVSRGYHGTSATHAAVILRDGFRPSDNDYDCLGHGVYFFEDGLAQAAAWATRAHRSELAVVEADVRLEDCLDLKDTVGWVPLLAQVHGEVLRVSREQGLPLPRQTSSTHRLDRVVIEVTVAILEREGTRIRAVRAVFAEGTPAFQGSFLSEGFHVQVAVRDPDLISSVNLVPAGLVDPPPPPRSTVAATASAVSPVVDPADAAERIRRYFDNASDRDLADDIRRAAPQPRQVGRLPPSGRTLPDTQL